MEISLENLYVELLGLKRLKGREIQKPRDEML